MPKTRIINAVVNKAPLVIHYITDDNDAIAAVLDLHTQRHIGYDVETTFDIGFELDHQGGLDPYRSRLRLIQFGKRDGTVYIIDNFAITDRARKEITALLESDNTVKVGHNLKFDVKFARHFLNVQRFGTLFCTELATRIVKCGTTFGRVSLLNASAEFLGIKIEKEEQRSNWSLKKLSDSQLIYAAYDAFVVLLLRDALVAWLIEMEMIQVAQLEFEALDPVCWMELNGLNFNPEGWMEAHEKSKVKRLKYQEDIGVMLDEYTPQKSLFEFAPPSIKLSSNKQMTWVLTDMGIELPEMSQPRGKAKSKKKAKKKNVEQGDLFEVTDEYADTSNFASQWEAVQNEQPSKERDAIKRTTRNWQIKQLKERYKIIGLLLYWREMQKRVTSYGEKYLGNVNPVTGRIHSDYDPLRSKTGRYGNSKPNLQQIPRDDDYRHCFIPTAGSKFVGADYSQIELRIAAVVYHEPNFIKAFEDGIDPHDNTTVQMFHLTLPPEKGTPEREEWEKTDAAKEWGTFRVFAKNINFGIPYGMGSFTLATRTGLTNEEAKQHLGTYHRTYPGLIAGLEDAAREVRETGQIRTLSGRIAKFLFDPNDPEDVGRAERNGKNTPIQGGNADILKKALRMLFDAIFELGMIKAIRLVHIVHDEIIVEADFGREELATKLLEKSMKEAADFYLQGAVPVDVEAKISTEWKK